MPLKVQRFPLGPLDTNCYLISLNGKALVIDPGGEPAILLQTLQQEKLALTHILNTHLHFDHTYGNAALQKACGVDILAGAEDAFMLENESGRGGIFGCPLVPDYQYTSLKPGSITLLNSECQVLHTPGHTPGSLSFYFPAESDKEGAEPGHVFTGDVLFHRSVGRTDFPGGNAKELRHSIREVLFKLPDNTVVWPGHGEETSIGEEKLNNPYYGQFARI